MSDFDKAFAIIVGVEGDYSDDPKDAGNWTSGKVGIGTLKGTKYGISAAAYPNEDIRNLTLEKSKTLYKRDYWNPVRGDELHWPLNLALFDAAVQHDPKDAIRLLQRAIGVTVDGAFGPRTLARAQTLNPIEASARLMRCRDTYYRSLSTWDHHGDGWINRLFRIAFAA
jgi:lysozyme family protein